MTILLIEGFDMYPSSVTADLGLNSKAVLESTSNLSFVAGRFGGQALRGSSTGGRDVAYTLPSTYATLTIAGAFRTSSLASTIEWMNWCNSTTKRAILAVDSNGAILVGTTNVGANLKAQSSNGVIVPSTWHFVECKIFFSATVGTVQVWVDGAQVINASALNMAAVTPDTAVVNVQIAGTSQTMDVDDIYVTDGNSLGEARISTIYPNADTSDKDFTRSTGSDNYALVDEPQANGDTDYVEAATAGDLDLYDFGSLGFTPTTIHAVQTRIGVKKTDGATRTARSKVKSASATANGATKNVPASYVWFTDIFTQDPNTSAAWTESGVNAAQFGPEVVS